MGQIPRRRFLFAGAVTLAAPTYVFAQQPAKIWRIGFLSTDPADSFAGKQAQREFPESLRRMGYSVGRDLLIEWRWGEGQISKLPALAEELVRLKVHLIVARTSPPIAAAMKASSTIPIVMLNGNYPVELGLVKSLAKPGGNVTGTTYMGRETLGKLLQLLKETAPRVTRMGILAPVSSKADINELAVAAVERAGKEFGMTVERFDPGSHSLAEIRSALEEMAAHRVEALFYFADSRLRAHAQEIADFLRDSKIASVCDAPGFINRGGLLEYSPDVRTFYDRTASYVARIFKGAKPADLPVELPIKFELGVNLKTAKALGIVVPQSILLRADRVIE